MATTTQETLTTSATVKRVPPGRGTEPKRYASLDAYRGFIMLILPSGGSLSLQTLAIRSLER